MLVLSRKTEQKILINGDTVVQILRVSGDRVVLGIDAPKSVNVVRMEILENAVARCIAEGSETLPSS
jgi:carbon storage regulator